MNEGEDDILSWVSSRCRAMSIAKRGIQTELEFAQRGDNIKSIAQRSQQAEFCQIKRDEQNKWIALHLANNLNFYLPNEANETSKLPTEAHKRNNNI